MLIKQNPHYKSSFQLIYIILFSVFTIPFSVFGYQNDFYNSEVNYNMVYKSTIKSVLMHKVGFEMSEPIIQLHSNEKILLSFDDLDDAKVKNFKYTIQHCDPYWLTSDLLNSQYIEGYFEDYINEYEFSVNTTIPFIHYTLEFPNEYIKPLVSGNYILKVYEDESNNLILTRRFKIYDPQLNIEAKVNPTERASLRNSKQEIGFSIHKKDVIIQNPERDLSIVVQQNNRIDNTVTDIKPVRYLGNEIDYTYNQKTVFDGGNEFRNFDTKSLKYRSEYIKHIEYSERAHHVYLWEEKSKMNDNYHFEHDINGAYVIKNSDGYNDITESDYCWVYFFVESDFLPMIGELYIMGNFNDWIFKDENKLTYNFKKKGYETRLFLKQGYYNYQYIFFNKETKTANIQFMEGNHFETTNDYSINVYYLEPGTYYYQLIGYQKITAPN